jgi:hypothetical protein
LLDSNACLDGPAADSTSMLLYFDLQFSNSAEYVNENTC